MPHGDAPSAPFAAYLATFYGEMLFAHPWLDDELPSLVYERDGAVVGFVGVVPRPAVFDGCPVRVAVSVRFMVDHADPRAAITAAALHMRFLSGPQDVSLLENGNAMARRVWEAARGAALLPVSSVSWQTTSCATAVTIPSKRVWESRPATDDDLLECILTSSEGRLLRPVYDRESLRWLLGFLESASYRGALHRRLVLDPSGAVRGWYVFYANPAGYNGVLALRCTQGAAGPVVGRLLADVEAVGGSPVTTGRLQPELMSALAEHGGTLAFGPWAVVHSRNPKITAAADAFPTRLEGEFC